MTMKYLWIFSLQKMHCKKTSMIMVDNRQNMSCGFGAPCKRSMFPIGTKNMALLQRPRLLLGEVEALLEAVLDLLEDGLVCPSPKQILLLVSSRLEVEDTQVNYL